MSGNFWAQRLGQQPQQPAAPAPAPASAPSNAGAWWMPQAAQPTPQTVVQQPQQPLGPNPTQQELTEANAALLHRDEYSTTKAKSASVDTNCPDCGSPNYMRASTSPNSMKQCFNCGFNERFQHSTHGASGIGQSDLPTKAARVQTLNTSNWNPQTIVGKVTTV